MFALKTLTRWTTGRNAAPAVMEGDDIKLPRPIVDCNLDAAIDETLSQYPVVMAALAKLAPAHFADVLVLNPDTTSDVSTKPALEVAHDDAL